MFHAAKPPATLQDIFSLKQVLPKTSKDKVITFDAAMHNIGNSDSLPSKYFVAPQLNISRSLYWMHIGVEITPLTPAYVRLFTTTNTSLSIKTTSTENNTQTISISGLVQLEPGTQMSLISGHNVTAAYWLGFTLNKWLDPLVAFYVACSESTLYNSVLMYNTHIRYDVVIFNEGNAWDTGNSRFVAPRDGVYLFSANIEFESSGKHDMRLVLVEKYIEATGYIAGLAKINEAQSNMVSASGPKDLKRNVSVWVKFMSNDIKHSNPKAKASSLSAFYYSPVSNTRVVFLTTELLRITCGSVFYSVLSTVTI